MNYDQAVLNFIFVQINRLNYCWLLLWTSFPDSESFFQLHPESFPICEHVLVIISVTLFGVTEPALGISAV